MKVHILSSECGASTIYETAREAYLFVIEDWFDGTDWDANTLPYAKHVKTRLSQACAWVGGGETSASCCETLLGEVGCMLAVTAAPSEWGTLRSAAHAIRMASVSTRSMVPDSFCTDVAKESDPF